ncbi:hypothetical protein AX14_009007 [Amanita brunnescens Koide BX004]|nr:hypothetical protein AX14_009007 [Amanita brunnescens Koide BX004]
MMLPDDMVARSPREGLSPTPADTDAATALPTLPSDARMPLLPSPARPRSPHASDIAPLALARIAPMPRPSPWPDIARRPRPFSVTPQLPPDDVPLPAPIAQLPAPIASASPPPVVLRLAALPVTSQSPMPLPQASLSLLPPNIAFLLPAPILAGQKPMLSVPPCPVAQLLRPPAQAPLLRPPPEPDSMQPLVRCEAFCLLRREPAQAPVVGHVAKVLLSPPAFAPPLQPSIPPEPAPRLSLPPAIPPLPPPVRLPLLPPPPVPDGQMPMLDGRSFDAPRGGLAPDPVVLCIANLLPSLPPARALLQRPPPAPDDHLDAVRQVPAVALHPLTTADAFATQPLAATPAYSPQNTTSPTPVVPPGTSDSAASVIFKAISDIFYSLPQHRPCQHRDCNARCTYA